MEMSGLLGFRIAFLCSGFLLESVLSIWLDVPDSVTIVSGHPMVIDCNIMEYNQEKVSWKNSDWELNPREHKQEMLDGEDGKKILRLTIDQVESEDSGMYSCFVEGNLEERVVFADMSTLVTSGANVTEGFDANLKCKLTPVAAARIFWHKNNDLVEQIPSLKDRISLDERNYSLTIKNAMLADAGTYTCEVQLLGFTEQIITETVLLQGKPFMLKTTSSDDIFSATDKSLILKCPVKGTPNPEVFWQRGEDVLELSDKYAFTDIDDVKSAHLEISEPTKEDYGEYVCTAENVMGKVDVTLIVLNSTLAEISTGQGVSDSAHALWPQLVSLFLVTIPVTLLHLG